MNFTINHLTSVIFGEGASQGTGEKLRDFGITKVLCVYDKGIKAAGLVDTIIQNVQAEGIKVIEFGEVLPDPPDTIVDQAGELGRKEGVDGILGIGGGSSMDAAKGVNVLLGNPGVISDYFNPEIMQKPGKFLFLIPTTSGTGSEVTGVAVLTNTKDSRKCGVIGKNSIAALAIVDPKLTFGLPPGITAATGMDAFSHAVEAYTTAMKNPMSDLLALEAISLIAKYLPVAVRDGSNGEARSKMSYAATIAGMSFNDAPPHIGHAIAHTIGAKYHVPHGTICGLAVPGVIEYVSDIMPEMVRSIGEAMGLSLKDDLSNEMLGSRVADAVRKLNREIGLPTMKDLNIPESGLPDIAADVLTDVCASFTPKKTNADDVLRILRKDYAR